MRTLDELVVDSAARAPEAPAVHAPDGGLTYAQLDALANRVAHALRELGVGHGDRVALWQPKGAAAVAAMQGTLRLGAAYVPVDPMSPPARARLIVDDCAVAAAVVERDEGLAIAGPELEPAIGFDELERLPAEPPPGTRRSADDLAYILYTSGSTGRPKGVCISHRNALAFVEWAVAELAVDDRDRLSNHAPLHFDLSVFDLYGAFQAGACVSLVPSSSAYMPRQLVEFVRDERITIWYSVPSALILMMEHGGLLDVELPQLRAVLFAGEPFPIKHLRTLRRRFARARMLNLYGPTETNVCTFHEVGEVPDDRRQPVPIGRACSGDRVRALREDGTEAEIGERGELVVEGATVMLGYWGAPRSAGEPYRTGDLVTRISHDEYQYVGRKDDMVKLRGHRVELGEIEAGLLAHPAVKEAAAVVDGEGIDSRLVGFVVPADGARPSLVELKRHCGALLPRYMIVDRVRLVEALPRTSTGKLDRRRLVDREGTDG